LARKTYQASLFDRARDELFSHIHRCGVLQATEEQQREWMDDTLEYMTQRYPDLSPEQTRQLRDLGLRFCKPVIPHGEKPAPLPEEDATAA
jgi:hypothetical protein